MNRHSLAFHLGTTAHLSPLLMKARGLGLRQVEDLKRLAVVRGCRYYQPARTGGDRETLDAADIQSAVGTDRFSNAELALALLSPCLQKSQIRLRIGAAMLTAPDNTVEEVVQLARRERSEAIVRHVAECGRQVEPDNPFWMGLLAKLPERPARPDVLPHISRFVAMTGLTAKDPGTVMQWIRPAAQSVN